MDLPIFGRGKVVQDIVWDVLVVVSEPEFGVFPDLSQGPEGVHIQHAAAVAPACHGCREGRRDKSMSTRYIASGAPRVETSLKADAHHIEGAGG
jgi:hypothetical protein